MKTLVCDIETYSSVDLKKSGVYRYTDDTAFSVLLFAYSINGQPVKIIDLTKGELPSNLVSALVDPDVIKWAHNAQFERVCLSKHLCQKLDPRQWRCSMVYAAELGLPQSLDQLARYLIVDQQKDKSGARLIAKFTRPAKLDELSDYADDWEKFKEYCKQDVRTEIAIIDKLSKYSILESEWELYALDQKINDYGIGVDLELIKSAVKIVEDRQSEAIAKLKLITELENPNSVAQLTQWLKEQGVNLNSLDKKTCAELLEKDLPLKARQALELRQAISNTSVKKYQAMCECICSDGRIHGTTQFYGASRTGRWAGRLVQVQNLPRNKLVGKELDLARELVKKEDPSITFDTLKSLIRTALIADSPLSSFLISDFSAIEARVLAWIAGEQWVLDTFADHGKIYEATAAKMYKCDIDEVDSAMRSKGKVAVLACGYGGGVNALKAFNDTLTEPEMKKIVYQWRDTNKNIVRLWEKVDKAANSAVSGIKSTVGPLTFEKIDNILFITLPNGRRLAYQNAKISNEGLTYEGQGASVAFTKQWTWGGKLVENITQAIARDILAEALLNLDTLGYKIVLHVHDEVVVENPDRVVNFTRKIDEILSIMSISPLWAEGLPLKAEGFKSKYYSKGG